MVDPREQADNARGDAPRVGDTLDASRAGRVDADIGTTRGGSPSHDRASFSDPISADAGEDAPADQRVAGSAPTTPADHPRSPE